MTNPTSNFGWQMPTSTDLVTDLPADFAVFGQAVDTSMADLKGGTTGQILSKATNTDMDFTWITNDVGDITAVNTTAPLQGGGTSGALTLSIDAGSTTVVGAVQLEDSTASTSTTKAATPNSVKSAYDLANAAIAKSTVTTAGDIIFRNATVPTRLGIGTAGQVLKVNSGATAPEWGSASASFVGVMCQRDTGTIAMTPSVRVAVPFTTEIADSNGFHDNSTNPSRFTVPTGYGGKYLLTAFGFLDVGSNSRFTLYYYKNGSDVGNQGIMQQAGNMASNNQAITGSRQVSLNAGDYVELFIQNDNSASPTVYAAFYMTYLGA